MWISARTATTLATAALLLVMVAVAAPLIPRPHLPSLPEERPAKAAIAGDKFGAAKDVLEAPERERAQRMSKSDPAMVAEGGARLPATGRYGSGPSVEPSADSVQRLVALLKDPRTVADSRAADAEATWVVRLVRDTRKVDVMVDLVNDRVVVALNREPLGSYGIAGLHREFAALGDALLPKP